jgi:putative DNA methylase
MNDDRRLIEDYLPIEAISAEASREKSVRKGHISTLHLWWARRPLVACRAAVYGALVPVSRFVPNGASDEKKKSLGRANAAKFMQRLCRYPSESKTDEKADIERAVREAQRHILEAHAERLSTASGSKITAEDIIAGRAPRPKVLDMFAGGGAIPLEALRWVVKRTHSTSIRSPILSNSARWSIQRSTENLIQTRPARPGQRTTKMKLRGAASPQKYAIGETSFSSG